MHARANERAKGKSVHHGALFNGTLSSLSLRRKEGSLNELLSGREYEKKVAVRPSEEGRSLSLSLSLS